MMFTGIIQTIGRIVEVRHVGGDKRVRIEALDFALDQVQLGDSIAVSGVCLTAIACDAACFSADISAATLSCTTLGQLREGDTVNLEKALRLADRLDGHLVSGHVDGVGKIISIEQDARSQRWVFEAPCELTRYIAKKGSICIDGISLTVNETHGQCFGVNLIPHTITATTLQSRAVGDVVNIEVDLVARYLERLISVSETPLSHRQKNGF